MTAPLRSMTGYGKAVAQLAAGQLSVEIRSLNGKNADVSFKSSLLPKEQELLLRKKVAERLVRGSIDVFLSFEAAAETAARPVNIPLAQAYFKQALEVDPTVSLSADARAAVLSAVLRLPDVVDAKKQSDCIAESDMPAITAAFDAALDAVGAYRIREGAALGRDLTARVEGILALYDEVEALEPERLAIVRERLLRNLAELQQQPDPARFEQELVFYLEKYDINEEKVRLRQHCRYFLDTMASEACPGRKLGFIVQEMGREINTTGSKANHAGIQALVVRMKDELEKVREQSLNIL